MTPRDGFPNAFGLGLSGWGFRAAQGLRTGPVARHARHRHATRSWPKTPTWSMGGSRL